jgi:hypothetical protein
MSQEAQLTTKVLKSHNYGVKPKDAWALRNGLLFIKTDDEGNVTVVETPQYKRYFKQELQELLDRE